MSLKGPTNFSTAKDVDDVEAIYVQRYGKENLQLFRKIIDIDNSGKMTEADAMVEALSAELREELKYYSRDIPVGNAKLDEIAKTQKALIHKYEAEKASLAKKIQKVDQNITNLNHKKEKVLNDQANGVNRKKGCSIL